MRLLKCQQCGAQLKWDGKKEIVKCDYCGAQYQMQARPAQRPSDPHFGYGEVMGIPMNYFEGMNFEGQLAIDAYVPEGWYACVGAASFDNYGDCAGNTLPLEGRFIAPHNRAIVIYRSSNCFTDRRRSPHMPTNEIDMLGTNMRVRKPFTMTEYCDTLLKRDAMPAKAKLVKKEQPDEDEMQRMQIVAQNYRSQGFATVNVDWTRRIYEITNRTGEEKKVAIETRFADVHKRDMSNDQPQKGFMGMLKGAAQNMMDLHCWETGYEMILISDPDIYDAMFEEFMKINLSIRPRQEYQNMKNAVTQYIQQQIAQTQQTVNNAMMNMQRERMESWDRRSRIIQDTNNYTTNIMREMNANTAATHDRVANLHSEAIRGVNTYYAAPGTFSYGNSTRPDVVEASINWDHVYQSTQNPDVFAATRDVWLEPGVDFVELKKTNGNY